MNDDQLLRQYVQTGDQEAFGSGRIVNCQFTSWEPIPDDLQKPANGKFLIHCVDWLANRVLE